MRRPDSNTTRDDFPDKRRPGAAETFAKAFDSFLSKLFWLLIFILVLVFLLGVLTQRDCTNGTRQNHHKSPPAANLADR
jgi:hypothetical protein